MIPVLGFATLKRFDLAERLIRSIDYPVEHLVIVDNSGTQEWTPPECQNAMNTWLLRVPYGLGLVGAWNLVIKSTPYAPYWLLVNDDAWFEPRSLEIIHNNVDTSTINFPSIAPKWSCVAFGEGMVEKVGLYDENFYPLYFDDDDLSRRIEKHGLQPKHIDALVHHENSSTLAAGFQEVNTRTYQANLNRLQTKQAAEDYSASEWSLKIRRENRWD